MFSGLNLSNVGFGGVEQYALFKLGRPDHLHLYQKDVSPVVPAAHIDDAVFAERVVGYQLHRKKMQVLWLRYLTEINEDTREIPKELLANPELKKAVNALEESAFTDAQLAGYEKFWDIISVEKTLYNSAIRKGMEKGMEKGIKEGIKEGHKEVARNLKKAGIPVAIIMQSTGLSEKEIEEL